MTLIEILYEYAFDTYHYGRKKADLNLRNLKLDAKVMRAIQLSVSDDGDFVQSNNDDGDFVFIPWGWKKNIYRPNDSRQAPLPEKKIVNISAQTDPRLN